MDRLITKKDFQALINETASGFQNAFPSAPKPVTVQTNTAQGETNGAKQPQKPDYDHVELVNDPKVLSGEDWAKYGGNFPIKRNGKVFYVSRSVAVSLCVFCRDKNGNWRVLANQRGPSCHSNAGKWNVPAGYLDYGESAEGAAVRETWEETGVWIEDDVPLRLLGTNASVNKDDVSMAFTCVLEGVIDDYPLSAENSEPGEVSDIRWIPIMTADGRPLKDLWKYKWNRDPKAILSRAQTALTPYINSNYNYDELVKKLKHEIGANPTALYLLDKILAMNNKDESSI